MFGFLSKPKKKEAPPPPKGAWSFPGIRLHFLPGISVVLQRPYMVCLLLFFIFYTFAGETSSEWTYFLAASILAMLVLGLIYPFGQVLDAKASVFIPGEAVATEKLVFEILLSHAILRGFLAKMFPLRCLRIKLNLTDQDGKLALNLVRPAVVEYVGTAESAYLISEPLKRGVYRFDSLEAASCFPFTLAWWLTKVPATLLLKSLSKEEGRLTVYPVIMPMRGRFLQTLGASGELSGQLTERHRAAQVSSSVRGLREYRVGDSPRWVHWNSFARTGKLVVKEFDTESSPKYFVALDPCTNWRTEEQFELAVALASSIVHCNPELLNFELLVPSDKYIKDVFYMPSGLQRSREILARVQPGPNDSGAQTKDNAYMDHYQGIERAFSEKLKRHPGAVIFNVVPGGTSRGVNLLEATIDKHGHAVASAPQRVHVRTRVLELFTSKESPRSDAEPRGRVIARVSHLEQITMV
jgi:uncharacterized protein (DUF58 family)